MPKGYRNPAFRPVLIIGDVVSQAMTLELVCRSFGVDTHYTPKVEDLAAVLDAVGPAAIITGFSPPGVDDLRRLQAIAVLAPALPVMVVTASASTLPHAAPAMSGDRVSVLPRPVSIGTLRAFLISAGLLVSPSNWDLHWMAQSEDGPADR